MAIYFSIIQTDEWYDKHLEAEVAEILKICGDIRGSLSENKIVKKHSPNGKITDFKINILIVFNQIVLSCN